MKKLLNRLGKGEAGQALIMVLILLLVGGLIVAPLLGFIHTGLTSGEVHEQRMGRVYAADSGVEDALWKIKSDDLPAWMDGTWDDAVFNHVPPSENYTLSSLVNSHNVSVSLQPTWVLEGLEAPISGRTSPEELLVTGATTNPGAGYYQIKIVYDGTLGDVQINKIGMWLPPGFDYDSMVTATSDLDATPSGINDFRGGKEIWWNTSTNSDFNLPSGSLTTKVVDFQYTPSGSIPQAAFSWARSSSLLSWDADLKIFKINSIATHPVTGKQTEVEAYTAKNELRAMSAAVSGDYYAIGNSLLGGSGHPPDNYHYQLYNSTQSSIATSSDPSSGIPGSAVIEAAYLYWTGWIDWHNYDPAGIFYDNCDDFVSPPVNWQSGSSWSISGGWGGNEFRGRGGYASGNDVTSDTYSLAAYSGRTLNLSVDIDEDWAESGDYLYYQFYNSSGWSSPQTIFEGNDSSGTYSVTIPEEYVTADFRMRFTIDFTSTWEYVYLDNITIAPAGLRYPSDPTPENIAALVEQTARVNKVLFNDTAVTADTYVVLYPTQFDGTGFEDTWFYTAIADVADLMGQWIVNGDIELNGAGDYTLGHYYVGTDPSEDNYRVNAEDPSYSFDFYSGGGSTGYPLGTPSPSSYPSSSRYTAAHCGWSLLTIYSSPDTYGHQLYLYDIQNPNFDFFFGWHNNTDFDNDGSDGGTISGFLVPDPVVGETLAGRVTLFVGEGDAGYTGDYFRVTNINTGTTSNLSNGASPSNNVWNSNSPGLTVSGVDMDTFDITWASGLLLPGDTSVQIDLPTGTDGFTTTYIILSFRSDSNTGGPLAYVIRE